MPPAPPRFTAAVIGGGPAGLMAAERLAAQGVAVTIHDRMPSLGRKFLMAGRGGLNLTHAEPLDRFVTRYRDAQDWLAPAIRAFPPGDLIAWAEALGQPVFTGSSRRVFPRAMKASPLLRAWLRRLAEQGVAVRTRCEWIGWTPEGCPLLRTPGGSEAITQDVTILALGGASWPRLGGNGGWTRLLPGLVAPLRPANCGFRVGWSETLRTRAAGQPLKRIALRHGAEVVAGEALITADGIEGGAVYALSAALRDRIAAAGSAVLEIDLRPDLDAATVRDRLAEPRRGRTLSATLRRRLGLSDAAVALVQEALHRDGGDPATLVKTLPLQLDAAAPLDRAISTAGGLRRDALDDRFMLHRHPGVFAAGEMLDWEAPTGGYLLQACFATGAAAAAGALAWLRDRPVA